jgi:acyl-CoA reductase-like NAD-dependent aldehyde dehydrogenase
MDCLKVVAGGVSETTALLEQRFDHIFYTGNSTIAKIIAQKASKFLTPTVLELGGKSPVIIDKNANVNNAAKRTMWAKTVNAGQTCIAPDYVLCHRDVHDEFVEACIKHLKAFYGENIQEKDTYCRIINERHYGRIMGLIEAQKQVSGSKIVYGGKGDSQKLFIKPTIITGVGKNPLENPIMNEEIFGPVLPIIKVDSVEEAIAYINEQ